MKKKKRRENEKSKNKRGRRKRRGGRCVTGEKVKENRTVLRQVKEKKEQVAKERRK